ncbi:MAG: hypothetical protein WCT50_02320 [Patescibacteria group bacterium]
MSIKKINLVAADMGYGHQRAAYPLMDLGGGDVLTINDYKDIPSWEKKYWLNLLRSYEQISRFKKIPVLGKIVFEVMDFFQKIPPLYPFRNLSGTTTQQKYFFKSIKKGLGKDLIDKLSLDRLPLVTTFFVVAYMAEYHNYQGDIYCIICDTDISRAWAPINPKNSRTKFFAPSEKVKIRLRMYGVKEENIIISGFPLPKENVGTKQEILKEDLARRIIALDPEYNYRKKEKALLQKEIPDCLKEKNIQPLTITFAVGGAGAQKEIGVTIMRKLISKIKNKEVILNLVAGNRQEVADYFAREIKNSQLDNCKNVKIIFSKNKIEYFKIFNQCLHATDILWTKPSELSFYGGLGLPIVIASPVGSQEDFNREWLLSVGVGIDSLDPKYVDEWLFNDLNSGRLARAAMDGFLNADSLGTYRIEKKLLIENNL